MRRAPHQFGIQRIGRIVYLILSDLVLPLIPILEECWHLFCARFCSRDFSSWAKITRLNVWTYQWTLQLNKLYSEDWIQHLKSFLCLLRANLDYKIENDSRGENLELSRMCTVFMGLSFFLLIDGSKWQECIINREIWCYTELPSYLMP